MGRQIAINLSLEDEESLVYHLSKSFPVAVVDRVYPPNWDKITLSRSFDSETWLLIDTRTTEVLVNSATEILSEPLKGFWQIRSLAYSCIEWSRVLSFPGHDRIGGRLYLNTNPDPIWDDISTNAGDNIIEIYQKACRWIKRKCINCSENRIGLWVSKSKVEAVRKALSEQRKRARVRRENLKKDPRDELYYQLQRKKMPNLTSEEITLYISYCDRMIDYLSSNCSAIVSWKKLKKELQSMKL